MAPLDIQPLHRSSARDLRPEIMDQPDLEPALHRGALRALERVNRVSRTAERYWPEIERLAARVERPLRLLDVACGGGDVGIDLARLAHRRGVELEIRACDRSPEALDYARGRARQRGAAVAFFETDAVNDPLLDCDAIVCSLFLHHLDENQAVDLLRRMKQSARHLVLVSDLVRSRLGRLYAFVGTRLLTRSPVVHVDALLSVAAAFTAAEAASLAGQAGLRSAEIRTHFPQRFLLTWRSA